MSPEITVKKYLEEIAEPKTDKMLKVFQRNKARNIEPHRTPSNSKDYTQLIKQIPKNIK